MGTKFSIIYNRFLGKITDDMYLELTPADTVKDLQNMLIDAIPHFEYPRIDLYQYQIKVESIPEDAIADGDFIVGNVWGEIQSINSVPNVLVDNSYFEEELSSEEINILAILMMQAWVQRQVTSIEHTRMKYSGSDFKMTSQANHLQKLLSVLTETQRQSLHMQRLYKRREHARDGKYRSTWYLFGENSAT